LLKSIPPKGPPAGQPSRCSSCWSRCSTGRVGSGVNAPVQKGAPLGTLQLTLDGRPLREVPLYAAADVEQGPLWWRAVDMAGGYVASGAGWVANEITTRVMSAWNSEPPTTGSTAPAIPAPGKP